MTAKKPRPKDKRPRSAITGHFVSWWWALTHPRTAILERRNQK